MVAVAGWTVLRSGAVMSLVCAFSFVLSRAALSAQETLYGRFPVRRVSNWFHLLFAAVSLATIAIGVVLGLLGAIAPG